MKLLTAAMEKIAGPVLGIVDQMVEDKDKAAELKAAVQTSLLEAQKLQVEVSKEEAKHPSVFVAGARPFILWSCGIAINIPPILLLLTPIESAAFGTSYCEDSLKSAGDFILSVNMPILLGILGIGGARTYEKIKGVARENMKATPKA